MYAVDLFFFFFNDTPPTEIYPLSLHDALPISDEHDRCGDEEGDEHDDDRRQYPGPATACGARLRDRKSTRLNSSHSQISYAVFCLKNKKFKFQVSRLHQIGIHAPSSLVHVSAR